MTSRAEEYRRYARQCLEVAPTFQDKEARVILLGQAQAWLRLAHLALANRQIADLAVHAPQLTLGSDLEFLSRPEWTALERAYGLKFRA